MTLTYGQIFLVWVFGTLCGMFTAIVLMGPINIYNELRTYRKNLDEEKSQQDRS